MEIITEFNLDYTDSVKKSEEFRKLPTHAVRIYSINDTLLTLPMGYNYNIDNVTVPVQKRLSGGKPLCITPSTLIFTEVNGDTLSNSVLPILFAHPDVTRSVSNYTDITLCDGCIYPGEFAINGRKLISMVKVAKNVTHGVIQVTDDYLSIRNQIPGNNIVISLEEAFSDEKYTVEGLASEMVKLLEG